MDQAILEHAAYLARHKMPSMVSLVHRPHGVGFVKIAG